MKDMATKKPGNLGAFLQVHGVGEYKKDKFGQAFIDAICAMVPKDERFFAEEEKQKEAVKKSDFRIGAPSDTHIETLDLYRKGFCLDEIAEKRGLAPLTIATHFMRLNFHGEDVGLEGVISDQDIVVIQGIWKRLGEPEQIRPIYEEAEKAYQFEQIRYAVCIGIRDGLALAS